MDIVDMVICDSDLVQLCGTFYGVGYVSDTLITLRELAPPRLINGNIHGYRINSNQGELEIAKYDTNVRQRIKQLPDKNKRNFFRRVFESRMKTFLHKHFPGNGSDIANMNKTHIMISPDELLALQTNTHPHHHHHSNQLIKRLKLYIALGAPSVILAVFFICLCFYRNKHSLDAEESIDAGQSKYCDCFSKIICKLSQRKNLSRMREEKLRERLEFKKLHEELEPGKKVKNKKKVRIAEAEDKSNSGDDFRVSINRQRKMSIGASQYSSSSDDNSDDEIELFNKETIK
ncbi:uncharacterized protein LOC144348033 [Saccoglossus kowalevskii]